MVHLLRREQMLRMAREPRIDDPLDPRMLFQPRGDMHRVTAMALHAQREGLDAAQRQESIEGTRHSADRVLQEGELLFQLIVLADDRRAADDVGVAVEILRRRMHDDIEAVLERALDPGRSERVIAHADEAAPMANFGDRGEVDKLEQRVGRRLDP